MSPTPSPLKTNRLPVIKKLLFSAVTTVLFFASLELLLALLGIRSQSSEKDPFDGFARDQKLMELVHDDSGNEIYRTSRKKLVWFNDQSFPKKKGSKTKRVFCMGGSTTYGHPYWDSTSFSRWLREYLPVVDPSHDWEVINAGGISYASYRVAALMDELVHYDPDLFVVYSVHNEFLERRTFEDLFQRSPLSLALESWLAQTRTWTLVRNVVLGNIQEKRTGSPESSQWVGGLSSEVDEMLNHTIGPVDYHRDDDWKEKVLASYEQNVRRMVAIAREKGIPILLVTPASNEKDCSPFKWEYSEGISDENRGKIAALLDSIDREEVDIASQSILDAIQACALLDPRNAMIQYRLGQAFLARGEYERAKIAFRQAIEEDICPLRAVQAIRDAIDRVARDLRVPIVDLEEDLRQRAVQELRHSLFGDEYFLDHVHFKVDVHRRLSLGIIKKLQEIHFLPAAVDIESPPILDACRNIERKVLEEIDPQAQGIALRNLAKVLHWAGKFGEAEPLARDALELLPEDPESRHVLAGCLRVRGKEEEALREYERLFAKADLPRAYFPFGELLAKQGQWERAKAYLLMAIAYDSKEAAPYFALGRVHLHLEDYTFASECFEEVLQRIPNDQTSLFLLAQSHVGAKNRSKAIESFRRLLRLGPQPAEIHLQLGLVLRQAGESEEAAQEFKQAIALDPEMEEVIRQIEPSSIPSR